MDPQTPMWRDEEIAVGIHLEWNSNKGGLVDGLPDFQVPAYDDNDLSVCKHFSSERSFWKNHPPGLPLNQRKKWNEGVSDAGSFA